MKPLHVVVMGVAGCGKSAVGERAAAALGLPLIEGDAFHPPGNIEKMRARLEARGTKLLVVENSILDALPRTELRDDGIHFTPAGYAMLAERMLPEVLAAIGR